MKKIIASTPPIGPFVRMLLTVVLLSQFPVLGLAALAACSAPTGYLGSDPSREVPQNLSVKHDHTRGRMTIYGRDSSGFEMCLVPGKIRDGFDPESIVTWVNRDPEISALLALSSRNPIETVDQLKMGLYRLFEAKGHPVGSAWYSVSTPDPATSQRKAQDVYSGSYISGQKVLRNLIPGATYDRPREAAVQDFTKLWIMFQSLLLDDQANGFGVASTVYRFGPLNGDYTGSRLEDLPHTASSANGFMLWNPSYFGRAVDQQKMLRVYQIESNGFGVDISRFTDQSINPDSRIGTGEVVFPAGTSFEKLGATRYRFGKQLTLVDVDRFAPGKTNYIYELPLIPVDKKLEPTFIRLLVKSGDQYSDVLGSKESFDPISSGIKSIQLIRLLALSARD